MRNACFILISTLLVSCSPGLILGPTVTSTPTYIPTLIFTPIPSLTPTETATSTFTPTETPTKIEFTEWDETELNLNGNTVEFIIGKENSADIWGKWGIERLIINKDAIDYQKKISTMISAVLWQVYQYQSNSKISYEDFMKGVADNKINWYSSNDNGGFDNKFFTLDDVKQVKVEYLPSQDDPRLLFYTSGISNQRVGFSFEHGILNLYQEAPLDDSSLAVCRRAGKATG